MAQEHKLSLTSAIFINLNIMLGAGIFINSVVLGKMAGILGAFTYVVVGLLLLPLILSMSKLVGMYTVGGFYAYGQKEINSFAGFLSGWSYIVGKIASSVISTQVAILLLQSVFAPLAPFSASLLNGIVMTVFLLLNLLSTQSNSFIQNAFFWMKTIPIASAIVAGLYLFAPEHLILDRADLSGFIMAIPLVFFALSGFEAACSISNHIADAKVNGPKAILYSYLLVVLLTTSFQFLIYAGLGQLLEHLPDYRYLFPTFVATIFPHAPALGKLLVAILHTCIGLSALGGAYGVIFSNNWNVYTLAENHHLLASGAIVKLNRFKIPYLCVAIEGVIYFLFLIISHGDQLPLQQIAAFGPTITYGISALAAWYATRRNALELNLMVPTLAIGSCFILGAACIYSLVVDGMSSLLLFGALSSVGVAMYLYTKPKPSVF